MHKTVFLLRIFFAISLTSAFVHDTPLQLLPVSPGNNNITTLHPPTPPTTNNINNTNTPPTPNARVSYVCNPIFGTNLNAGSCTQAITLVGINTTPLSFGMRNPYPPSPFPFPVPVYPQPLPPPSPYDIALPYRWISPDGKCAVEPDLAPNKPEARASLEEIAVAGFVVVRHCADKGEEGRGGNGGIARGIGGDNNLRVIIFKYDPERLRCYGRMRAQAPLPPPHAHAHANTDIHASCRQIVDRMRATQLDVVFGPREDPSAGVWLPAVLVSDDGVCKITIRSTGPGPGNSDTWSWGRMWEVAVALVGVCVREGKMGVQTGLGEKGYLYMEVGGPQEGVLELEGEGGGGNGSIG